MVIVIPVAFHICQCPGKEDFGNHKTLRRRIEIRLRFRYRCTFTGNGYRFPKRPETGSNFASIVRRISQRTLDTNFVKAFRHGRRNCQHCSFGSRSNCAFIRRTGIDIGKQGRNIRNGTVTCRFRQCECPTHHTFRNTGFVVFTGSQDQRCGNQ